MNDKNKPNNFISYIFDSILQESKVIINEDLEYFNYISHNEYLPFIGDLYGVNYPKVLFVFESHYLKKEDKDKVLSLLEKNTRNNVNLSNTEYFSNAWYFNEKDIWKDFDKLILNKNYYNSRGVILDVLSGTKNNNRVLLDVFRLVTKVLNESKQLDLDFKDIIRNFAIMNFFQRPEINTGNSIESIKCDIKIACDNLNNVINIIKPEKVIFVSIKSYNIFSENNKELSLSKNIIRVAQPGCPSWNNHKLYNNTYLQNQIKELLTNNN